MPQSLRLPFLALSFLANFIAFLGGSAPLIKAAYAADEVGLVPHYAVYDLKLAERRLGGIVDVAGRFTMDIAATCEAWQTSTDMELGISTGEGLGVVSHSIIVSTEGKDGDWYEFTSTTTATGESPNTLSGRAEIGETGPGQAVFTSPDETTVDFPEGTLFPMAVWNDTLIQAFENDKKLMNHSIFDGTDYEHFLATDLVAGTPVPLKDPAIDGDNLLSGKLLRIITTYYEPSALDAGPTFKYTYDVGANGVMSNFTLDMEAFVVAGNLVTLQANPVPTCDRY